MLIWASVRGRHRVVKFTYSEKTKFCKISSVDLTITTYGRDFENICGLLRIYELFLIDRKYQIVFQNTVCKSKSDK